MQALQNQGQKVCCYGPHQKFGTAANFKKSGGSYSTIKLFQIMVLFFSFTQSNFSNIRNFIMFVLDIQAMFLLIAVRNPHGLILDA